VLHDVSAQAGPGKITAVLGPNAAGKSTLLRCIIGALKPTQGSVMLDGQPAHRLGARKIAQRLAYVSQRSIVSAAFTVRQVIELGRHALPVSAARVNDAIARMDLDEVTDRPYPMLSVGQQQRVALARAIAQLPADGHLILDEPVAAMDLRHVGDTMNLLRQLARGGATVVIAMHDLSLAASIADDAWLLDAGRMVAAGPACDVLSIQQLQATFGVKFEWLQAADGSPRLLPAAPGRLDRIESIDR